MATVGSEGSSRPPDRLDSWKEIANHLGRGIRTVQRWEKTEGLPVYRLQHAERGRAYAYTAELDTWWQTRRVRLEQERQEPEADTGPPLAVELVPAVQDRRRFIPALVLASLAAALAAGAVWHIRRIEPIVPTALAIGRVFARATAEGRRPLLIPLGDAAVNVAIHPDRREVYVGTRQGTLAVVSAASETVTHRIRLQSEPTALVLAPDGRRLYVSQYEGDIAVVDVRSKQVEKIRLPGRIPDMVLVPDGSRLYATSQSDGINRIDTKTHAITRLPGVICPMYLAVDGTANRMFVSYQCGGPGGSPGHDSIEVLDLATERSLRTFNGLPLVGAPLALTPDGVFLWASSFDACISPQYDHRGCELVPSQPVHVVRASDGSLVRSIVLPERSLEPGYLTLFPDGSRIMAQGSERVQVIDARQLKITETWEMGSSGRGAFAPDGRHLYLASGESLAILETVPTRCEPSHVRVANFWPADGNAEDVASSMPGSLEAGVTFAPGILGAAFRFDGRGGSVSMGVNRSVTGAEMTFALWSKPQSDVRDMGLFENIDRQRGWRLYRKSSGEIEFALADGSARLKSGSAAQAGRWTHVAVVRTARTAALYLDGVLSAEAPWHRYDAGYIRLGAGFDGLLDEVLWYARALSPSEIRDLYRAGKNGGCPE